MNPLEKFFGPSAVAFNSVETALTGVLEVLGSRTMPVPVVMSVCSPPWILATTLRAGGEPFLLDVEPSTLRTDPDALRIVLDEIEAPVVIVEGVNDLPKDHTTILITDQPPFIPHTTFAIHRVADGALVLSQFAPQATELRTVRSGPFGLGASMSVDVATKALEKILSPSLFISDETLNPSVFQVNDADRVIAHLTAHQIPATKLVQPLHLYKEYDIAFEGLPSYPVAEHLSKKLIALPHNHGIIDKEQVVLLISEVDNDD